MNTQALTSTIRSLFPLLHQTLRAVPQAVAINRRLSFCLARPRQMPNLIRVWLPSIHHSSFRVSSPCPHLSRSKIRSHPPTRPIPGSARHFKTHPHLKGLGFCRSQLSFRTPQSTTPGKKEKRRKKGPAGEGGVHPGPMSVLCAHQYVRTIQHQCFI